MNDSITAVKGFGRDMKCRGFQYKEGETYEHPGSVDVCRSGFHAVTLPLDVFRYYGPRDSVFHRVTLDGVHAKDGCDSKVAGKKITVGAKLNMLGIIQAHVEAVWDLVKKPSKDNAATTGYSAHAATTGDYAHAATTGDYAHAATTGGSAHAATTGYYAHAATTGRYANAATTGYFDGVRASVADEGAIAAVLGQGAARGAVGCWLVLTERDKDWNVLGVQAVQVDGGRIKGGVYYTLSGGQVVEA